MQLCLLKTSQRLIFLLIYRWFDFTFVYNLVQIIWTIIFFCYNEIRWNVERNPWNQMQPNFTFVWSKIFALYWFLICLALSVWIQHYIRAGAPCLISQAERRISNQIHSTLSQIYYFRANFSQSDSKANRIDVYRRSISQYFICASFIHCHAKDWAKL